MQVTDIERAIRDAGYEPVAAADGSYYVTVAVERDEDADDAHEALRKCLPDGWVVDWAGAAGDGLDDFRVHRA